MPRPAHAAPPPPRTRALLCQRRSLALDDLRAFLRSGQYLVIVLVDQRKFNHGGAATAGAGAGVGGDAPASASAPAAGVAGLSADAYTGHYVLVCGHDSTGACAEAVAGAGDDVFLVRDPASSRPLLAVPGEQLEEARRAFGTDEDVLVVRAASLQGNSADAVPCSLGVT